MSKRRRPSCIMVNKYYGRERRGGNTAVALERSGEGREKGGRDGAAGATMIGALHGCSAGASTTALPLLTRQVSRHLRHSAGELAAEQEILRLEHRPHSAVDGDKRTKNRRGRFWELRGLLGGEQEGGVCKERGEGATNDRL